jgi:hypothetical protein
VPPPWVDTVFWSNIGGAHANANLAVVSRAPDNLDVFVVQVGPFRVGHNSWNGSAWQGWEDLGAPPDGLHLGYSPAAIALANQLDVFVISLAFVLYRNHWKGSSGWSDWQTVGTLTPGAMGLPAVCPLVGANTALFVRGGDGAAYCKFLTPSGSGGPWQNLGGNITTGLPLTAVSWGLGRVGLFTAEEGDSPVLYKSYDPQLGANGWLPSPTEWDSLGGVVQTPYNLKAVSSSPDRLDVFFLGQDEQGSQQGPGVFHKWGDGSQWSNEWEYLWGPGVTHLEAVTWGPDRIDLFCRGGGSSAKSVYHRSWDGAMWSPAPDAEWEDIVGEFDVTHGPGVVSWGPNRLDVFMVAADESDGDTNVWHRWWNGTEWKPFKVLVPR